MSHDDAGVVVVGAGLGAIRLAENLRSNQYPGPITLIGAERYAPYDRPPLSKSVLLGKDDLVELKPQEFYPDSQITLRLGTLVRSIDTTARTVTVVPVESVGAPAADGDSVVPYSTLVLATGLVPRRFPGGSELAGVHVLRTFDDAVAIRSEIDAARSAVVIGAGFIGCEVAASLAERGLRVSLVEPAPTPLAAALGTEIGELVTRMHRANGVDVRTETGVAELVGEESVRAVRLADGSEIAADIVIVGIGSEPAVDYLVGSGITTAAREHGGGVACDAAGRTGVPEVFAVGDVANWLDAQGVPHRSEHWNNTVEQAQVVAAQILAAHPDHSGIDAAPGVAVPYFWSDQFGVKLQVLGAPRAGDTVHLVSDDGTKFLAYYSRDDILTGVVGVGKVGAVMKTRPKLVTPTPIGDVC